VSVKQKLFWWIYCVSGLVLLTTIAPALVSASDTGMVSIGIILLVLYGTWSWYLWIKALIELGTPKIEKGEDDEKR
jgi:hypothetical protein